MDIKEYLYKVEKPTRYIGNEFNIPDMNKPCKVRFCMCFPDVYEIAMSNIGIQILYSMLNDDKDIVCERCFAPWLDLGSILKEKNISLGSIETGRDLKDFDIVGFSVPYEMSYTNILYMLDLAKIPFRAKDRDNSYPLIVGGGPASANPEPIIDFFDAFFIGDGEESDIEFCNIVKKYKGDKDKILEEAKKIPGIYVPKYSKLDENGNNIEKVTKAVVKNLDGAYYPVKPLVPNMQIVFDRGSIELFRGCYAGCRFCQACFFYRPIRYRNKETISKLTRQILENCGFDEVGLSSLSTGDYEDIYEVLEDVNSISKEKNVNFQLPSLRLDSFTAELTKNTKKNSLTFAPEAGTQRLRNVINKNITDEDINTSMKLAFENGYRSVKLYFMLGLPTETDEDVLGIAEIANRIKRIYIETVHRKDISITISTALFIPKPVTPFQWVEQITLEEMTRKVTLLKEELYKNKSVRYNWHAEYVTVLEGLFARGDRKLSTVIESAYHNGARFDGWNDIFVKEAWDKALDENKVEVSKYTGSRDIEKPLPWDFIDFGVTKEYLKQEYLKSLNAEITPPCKYKCNGCGASKLGKCRQYVNKECK